MAKRTELHAKFRSGYSPPVKAAVAHGELERIRAENDGTLRPKDVVDESRPKKAPLHPVFTWDDLEAAEKWREDEARRLIRSVVVIQPDAPAAGPQPIYVHVRPDDGGPDVQRYLPVAEVRRSPVQFESVLLDALAQLRGWQNRYKWIAELSSVHEAISAALEELTVETV